MREARRFHFYGMSVLARFLFLRVSAAFAVKGTVQSMFTGRLSKAQQEKLRSSMKKREKQIG